MHRNAANELAQALLLQHQQILCFRKTGALRRHTLPPLAAVLQRHTRNKKDYSIDLDTETYSVKNVAKACGRVGGGGRRARRHT